MTKRVLIDLDGVVADFVGAAMKLHGKPWPFDDEFCGPDAWEFFKRWGMTEEEFYRGMDSEFWASIPLYENAKELVSTASSIVGPENVCFVSNPMDGHGAILGKKCWVREHFPQIPLILSVPAEDGSPPKHFLASPDSILIDDCERNCKAFRRNGGEAWVFPQPWNSNLHNFKHQIRATECLMFGWYNYREHLNGV